MKRRSISLSESSTIFPSMFQFARLRITIRSKRPSKGHRRSSVVAPLEPLPPPQCQAIGSDRNPDMLSPNRKYFGFTVEQGKAALDIAQGCPTSYKLKAHDRFTRTSATSPSAFSSRPSRSSTTVCPRTS